MTDKPTDKPGLLGMLESMKAEGSITDYTLEPDVEHKTIIVSIRPQRYEAFISIDLGFDMQPTAAPFARSER